MISKISAMLGLLVFLLLVPYSTPAHSQSFTDSPPLLLNEVKFKNDASGYDEFIELYNNSTNAVMLSDYDLIYFNSSHPSQGQAPTGVSTLPASILESGDFLVLAKQPDQIPNSLKSPFTSLVDSGGTLRLIGTEKEVVDEVVWTSSDLISYSMNRLINESGVYTNPSVWVLYTPSPGVLNISPPPIPEEPEEEPVDGGQGSGLTCEGIIISEILPNPVGSDIGNEFIELHNPTNEVVSLRGCVLQTSANAKTYKLDAVEMQPGDYIALYDSVTGLSLPNSAGGTVWLLSPTDELQAITYASGLGDDVSWIWHSGIWRQSFILTPNAPNELLSEKPCLVGQERNRDTGMCRNIVTAASVTLTPCREGQERNPETNRCRAIASATSSLTPCREGQERNPATNRCRSIGDSDGLVPCAEGQERNPDTNRCRRVVAVAGSATPEVKDVYAGSLGSNPRWLLIGLVAVSVIGYALFEWRHEVWRFLRHSKS